LHLLKRGEHPSNIRILDIRPPIRRDLQHGPASQVAFVKVDITNLQEVKKAFDLPWPNESSNASPLTVFHTAAVIRFFERSSTLKHLSDKVNVLGTQNILTAAAQAGASYFIYTSSGSIHGDVVNYFVPPWASRPKKFFQLFADDIPMPSVPPYISNYTSSKRSADNIVLSCNGKGTHNGFMATGSLRPGNMIYGPGKYCFTAVGLYLTSAHIGGDPAIGNYLRNKVTPTWVQNCLQNQVYVENVSIAHLLFEQRLMEDQTSSQDNFGGKSFLITDPNPAIAFGDIYNFLTLITNGETRFPKPPPFLMLLLAYILEFYHTCQYRLITALPFLKGIIPPLGKDIVNLQPGMFSTSSVHIIVDDSRARSSPAEGGLGYHAPFTTMMGLSKTVHAFLAEEEKDYTLEEANAGHTISRAEHGVGVLASKVGVIEKS
jgi:nucleoside-diphosphate-sugar epimerase